MSALTIGSLCSGYAGLDMAAEQVTGGTTVWHCEYEAAPSALLALRFRGVPNHHDVKALTWADSPVDVLTAGYPCQPFSGAGKRMGTDDPRHLFPWIAMGVERMRPPLLLLENVRGHLSLGFDVVLAELHRIGYDVRWTILRAADVGAPHGRARLWIAARAREVGGWPRPLGEPTALAHEGEWVDPSPGLFGHHDALSIGTAGVMVDGERWDTVAGEAAERTLLPTPTSAAGLGGNLSRSAVCSRRREAPCARGREQAHRRAEVEPSVAVLPSTVRVGDHKGCDPNPRGVDLNQAVHDALLPTPRATDGTKGGPNQRGSSGDLMLPSAVHQLLPTPATTDARGARNSTSGRKADSQHHTGDTLGDLVFDGWLLPTPAVNDMGAGKTVEAWDEWTAAQKAKHGNGNGHGPSLSIEAARHGDAWGPYAAAVARWEALTRPAPAPTEQGRSGPRLSPAFVEWMQGLDAGWVTDVPGLTRNHQLTMLGNGVVPQCAAAAYVLLGVADLFREAAA